MVDLRKDCERIKEMWRSSDDSHVPLPLAAALVFHDAHEHEHEHERASVARPEYEDALNLAAAALSRLVEVYRLDERGNALVPVEVRLGAGRFRDAASRYERHNGEALAPLLVRREHVLAAVTFIRAAGIPFRFSS